MQWKTNTKWVDVETGEELTEETVKKEYTVVNKKAKSTVNNVTNKAVREITKICKKSNQLKLF